MDDIDKIINDLTIDRAIVRTEKEVVGYMDGVLKLTYFQKRVLSYIIENNIQDIIITKYRVDEIYELLDGLYKMGLDNSK